MSKGKPPDSENLSATVKLLDVLCRFEYVILQLIGLFESSTPSTKMLC